MKKNTLNHSIALLKSSEYLKSRVFELSYFLKQNRSQFGSFTLTDSGKWEIDLLNSSSISTSQSKNKFDQLGEEMALALWRTTPKDEYPYQTDFLMAVLPIIETFFHEKISGFQSISLRAVRIHPRRAEFVIKGTESIKWVICKVFEKLGELYGEKNLLSTHKLADGNQLITLDTYPVKMALSYS